MRYFLLIWIVSGCMAVGQAQPSLEEVQAEIAELEKRIQELESHKAQLEALEAQLKEARPAQPTPVARLSGFVQFRYVHDTAVPVDANDPQRGSARDSFTLRTVRLDGVAQPRPDTLYRVNLNASERQVSVVDAFVEFRRPQGRYLLGLFRVPLLYETIESNADRLTPEASQMVSTLFPTERDVGIAYIHSLDSKTQLTLGVFTGDRSSATQQSLTSRKSLLARLHFQTANGFRAWVGGMAGEGRSAFPPSNTLANYTRERFGGGILWESGSWFVRAEAIWGRHLGSSLANPTVRVNGGYLLLAYTIPNSPLLLYGKYDTFDPNTQVPSNTFCRYAIGVGYHPNPSTRFNLTYETPTQPVRSERWTLQMQVRY